MRKSAVIGLVSALVGLSVGFFFGNYLALNSYVVPNYSQWLVGHCSYRAALAVNAKRNGLRAIDPLVVPLDECLTLLDHASRELPSRYRGDFLRQREVILNNFPELGKEGSNSLAR